jgi:hypothetical protein
MNIKDILRLQGYAVTADGNSIECHPGTPLRSRDYEDATPRFQFMRVAVISFEVERGNARELVDAILAKADITPRAIIGKRKDGSIVALFRLDKDFPIAPSRTADTTDGAFKLAAKDDSSRFTVAVKSLGETVDVSAYTWAKGRSPLEVARDALPVLTIDVSNAVVDTAHAFGTTPWMIEYQRKNEEDNAQLRERMANGEIPNPQDLAGSSWSG